MIHIVIIHQYIDPGRRIRLSTRSNSGIFGAKLGFEMHSAPNLLLFWNLSFKMQWDPADHMANQTRKSQQTRSASQPLPRPSFLSLKQQRNYQSKLKTTFPRSWVNLVKASPSLSLWSAVSGRRSSSLRKIIYSSTQDSGWFTFRWTWSIVMQRPKI